MLVYGRASVLLLLFSFHLPVNHGYGASQFTHTSRVCAQEGKLNLCLRLLQEFKEAQRAKDIEEKIKVSLSSQLPSQSEYANSLRQL